MNRTAIFFIVLALTSLACGSSPTPVLVATSAPPSQNTQPPPPTAATIQNYQVGDVVSIGTLTLTVNEVTYPLGDDFTKPEAGKKFIVIDLTIQNNGASSVNISSLLQMSLKDETGQRYDVDLMATVVSGGTSPDGEIIAGDKLRGQAGFQIPESAAGLVFIFDASILGEGTVRVAIP